MLAPIRPNAPRPLSDIAELLRSHPAGDEQELRSRDGRRLLVKDGPTGKNRFGGRELHRSRAQQIITTALAQQLVRAGMDRKDAEQTSLALMRQIRPQAAGAQAEPLRVRHVVWLREHAEAAAHPGTSAKAYCDTLLAPPRDIAGLKVDKGLRVLIPRPAHDNKIIEAADFAHGLVVTIERRGAPASRRARDDAKAMHAKGADAKATRGAGLPTQPAAPPAHWSITDAASRDPRRMRLNEAIHAAREGAGGGGTAERSAHLLAALKACAAALTPVGCGDLAAPDATDLPLWLLLAEGLCLEDDTGKPLCCAAQLRTLSLSDRSSVLLALALEAKRAQASAPGRATRAYLMLSHLLEAVTDEDLMPPTFQAAQQRFQEVAAADFRRGAQQWAGMRPAGRQVLLVTLARHHAACFGYQVPQLSFESRQGHPVMLALAERRLPVDTDDAQVWNSFEKMSHRLAQDLLPFWQFEQAGRFERGAIAGQDMAMARLLCVGNVPPLSTDHLAAHVGEPLARRLDAMAPTARQAALHAQCWLPPLHPHPAHPARFVTEPPKTADAKS